MSREQGMGRGNAVCFVCVLLGVVLALAGARFAADLPGRADGDGGGTGEPVTVVVPLRQVWRIVLDGGPGAVSVPVPLLAGTTPGAPFAFQTARRGEPMDMRGYPLRWLDRRWTMHGYMEPRGQDRSPLPSFAYVPRARGLGFKGPILAHLDIVERCARETGVPVAVLLAVMQVESRGQTGLVSSRDAVGLMQVIPDKAGEEVSRYLAGTSSAGDAGEAAAVDRAGLFAPDVNIRFGAVYLRLLYRRHFAAVKDREARALCALAGYNIGPNRLLRLFGPDAGTALERINAYTAAGLYAELRERAGAGGAYTYLDRVITLMNEYRAMGYPDRWR